MKLVGFLLLVSGWAIVFAALMMLHGNTISVFVILGFAVELLGLVLAARAHLPADEDRG